MYRVSCEEVAKLQDVIKQVILSKVNWYISVCPICNGDGIMDIRS
jgi:hypothetical protein